jgi:hypothetical protein
VRAHDDRRPTFAAVAETRTAGRQRGLEQGVDLTEAVLDRDYFQALLDEQILAETVTAVHLEHEAAEIADALLAGAHEGTALAAQRTGGGQSAWPGRG